MAVTPWTLGGVLISSLTGSPSHRIVLAPSGLVFCLTVPSDRCHGGRAGRPAINTAAHHDRPDQPRRLVGKRDEHPDRSPAPILSRYKRWPDAQHDLMT